MGNKIKRMLSTFNSLAMTAKALKGEDDFSFELSFSVNLTVTEVLQKFEDACPTSSSFKPLDFNETTPVSVHPPHTAVAGGIATSSPDMTCLPPVTLTKKDGKGRKKRYCPPGAHQVSFLCHVTPHDCAPRVISADYVRCFNMYVFVLKFETETHIPH